MEIEIKPEVGLTGAKGVHRCSIQCRLPRERRSVVSQFEQEEARGEPSRESRYLEGSDGTAYSHGVNTKYLVSQCSCQNCDTDK